MNALTTGLSAPLLITVAWPSRSCAAFVARRFTLLSNCLSCASFSAWLRLFAIRPPNFVDDILQPGIGFRQLVEYSRPFFFDRSGQERSYNIFALLVRQVEIWITGHCLGHNFSGYRLWTGILVSHLAQLLCRLLKLRTGSSVEHCVRPVQIILGPPLMSCLFSSGIGPIVTTQDYRATLLVAGFLQHLRQPLKPGFRLVVGGTHGAEILDRAFEVCRGNIDAGTVQTHTAPVLTGAEWVPTSDML